MTRPDQRTDDRFASMPRIRLHYDPDTAIATLARKDRTLGRLMRRVGEFRLPVGESPSAFAALLRAVVYQQISRRSADAIHARLLALFPRRYPSPARLLALDDAQLRSAGLSRPKARTARELAERTLDGTVPHAGVFARLDDAAVIERVTAIHGLGPWSAQLLLIFHLGRADVLPATDLGIRRGYHIAFGGDAMPSADALATVAERWRPYRSVASWYLWRANYL